MKASSAVQSSASVQTRENGRLRLSRQAPVFRRPTKPGPLAGEVAGQQERVVLTHHALGCVWPVDPVDANPDDRVVHGSQLSRSLRAAWSGTPRCGYGLCAPGGEERPLPSARWPRVTAGKRQLVRFVATVARPEDCDALLHRLPPIGSPPRATFSAVMMRVPRTVRFGTVATAE